MYPIRSGRPGTLRCLPPTNTRLDGGIHGPVGPDEDRDGGFAGGGRIGPHGGPKTGAAINSVQTAGFDLLLGRPGTPEQAERR